MTVGAEPHSPIGWRRVREEEKRERQQNLGRGRTGNPCCRLSFSEGRHQDEVLNQMPMSPTMRSFLGHV